MIGTHKMQFNPRSNSLPIRSPFVVISIICIVTTIVSTLLARCFTRSNWDYNFLEQKNRVSKLMSDCGFQLIKKSTEKNIPVTKEFSNTFNYIYER